MISLRRRPLAGPASAALAVAVPLIALPGAAEARDSFGLTVTVGSGHGYGHHGSARPRILPPQVIRATLRAYYDEVSRPEWRDGLYVARAEDRWGRDLIVSVDPYTARIVDVRYPRRGRHGGGHGHHGHHDHDRDRHDRDWDDDR